jgi:hypothetical protein
MNLHNCLAAIAPNMAFVLVANMGFPVFLRGPPTLRGRELLETLIHGDRSSAYCLSCYDHVP